METLFGISMDSIMIVMLVLLFLCLALVAFIAWRRPVIFRMGIRNIFRRKVQTALIIVGLMLATLIMSAALATGDTMNNSVNSAVFELLGPVDQFVVASNDEVGQGSIQALLMDTVPVERIDDVRVAVEGLEVDAVGGALLTMGPVIDLGETSMADATGPQQLLEVATASNPEVTMIGASQESYDAFGGLRDLDGNTVDVSMLGAEEVYISEKTAEDLRLDVGDNIAYFLNNRPYGAAVRGIVPNTALAGGINPNSASMVVGFEHLQEATGNENRISGVMISNTGGTREGLDHSKAVTEALEERLGGTGLGVVPIKQMNADNAEFTASLFVTMFVVFGLFSISVGILLIVLIFTMLAAERRPEMGMTRAVGAQRRQLIQQFIAEGAGYTLISGLVGTALGVGAAWIIAQGMGGLTGGMFGIQLYVHPRSMVIAYSLGVVITFLAVILSSWRVSKLNVVAAIRDIPEVYRAHRNRSQLLLGAIGIVAGSLFTLQGWANGTITPFLIGTTILPFGLAAILAYFGANTRLVLSLVGLFVLVWWLLPTDVFEAIVGDRFNAGGIELFFISGISIVAASTMIIVQNLDVLLALVRAFGGRFRGLLSSVRLGIAYPHANAGRAGMTIAMFALIVFSIVVMGTMNSVFTQAILGGEANAGMQVRVDVPMANPIDEFSVALEEAGVDTSLVSDPGRIDQAASLLDQQLIVADDGEEDWDSGYFVQSLDATYLDETQLRFTARAEGFDTDEAIREALKTQANVMVIPSYLATGGNDTADFSFGGMPGERFEEIPAEGIFEPQTVQMRGASGETFELTVIGVLDPDYTMMFGYYIGTPTMDQLMPPDQPRFSSYYMSVAEGVEPGEVAAQIERELLQYGVQGVDIEQEMLDAQQQQSSFMLVMQGFMGLGMIVGVAAVGVISYRAVVERRQQIGMLRALGFQTVTVARAFVIETAVVVVLGSLSGAILGLILSWNLVNDPATTGGISVDFEVPWMTVIVTVTIAIVAALVMSWFPARQASRILPAEALRYE
jgi:putative ABC transport system permease protein